jgi:hypothetical protein
MASTFNPSFDIQAIQAKLQSQFSDLDPRDPSAWPSLPRYGLLLATALAVIAVLWFVWLSSAQEMLQEEQAREVRLRENYKTKLTKAVNLDVLKKQREQVQQYVTQLEKQLPSKAEMDAIKARFRDIAARPIAKVVEARARKKRRIGVAMEKAKKTATGIMESEEMGGRAKAKAVAKAYRQAEAKKVGSKYVVSGASGKKTGPKGAAGKRGGKTKVVDPRLKKDKRAIKRKEKSKKGGRRR